MAYKRNRCVSLLTPVCNHSVLQVSNKLIDCEWRLIKCLNMHYAVLSALHAQHAQTRYFFLLLHNIWCKYSYTVGQLCWNNKPIVPTLYLHTTHSDITEHTQYSLSIKLEQLLCIPTHTHTHTHSNGMILGKRSAQVRADLQWHRFISLAWAWTWMCEITPTWCKYLTSRSAKLQFTVH